MKKFFEKALMTKDNGDKAIVVEVGLAVIAVVLLVLFRSEMTEFITTLVDSMQSQISGILTAGGIGGTV
ncbi:MAG: hypothetical protein IJZ84_02470 [Lachnospiraceae bacterium]|nr:hypothetical protein [Lachnospiraceae bacterium]